MIYEIRTYRIRPAGASPRSRSGSAMAYEYRKKYSPLTAFLPHRDRPA